MAKTYRACAIGRTGRGGFGHGLHLAYQDLPNVEFAAVADDDDEGRAKAKDETGAPQAYADYGDMLREEEPDLVSVGPRWTDCHLEMVLACLEAGAHVYCEKPMTWNLEEGDTIVARAAELGKKVAVSHQGVYLPGTRRVRDLLNEGRIGQVQAIYAHGKQDRRGGGEDMIVLGTHLFNTMRFLVGSVSWMSAHVTAEGHEITPDDVREPTEPVGPVAGDCINAYFSFESGVSGFFDSRADQPGAGQRFGMEICGSEGTISIRGGAGGDLAIYPHAAFLPRESSRRWEPIDGVDEASLHNGNQLAIVDLIDAIENDRKPVSAASDAVAALEMILGTYESQITGARVDMPMKNRKHPLAAWKKGELA